MQQDPRPPPAGPARRQAGRRDLGPGARGDRDAARVEAALRRGRDGAGRLHDVGGRPARDRRGARWRGSRLGSGDRRQGRRTSSACSRPSTRCGRSAETAHVAAGSVNVKQVRPGRDSTRMVPPWSVDDAVDEREAEAGALVLGGEEGVEDRQLLGEARAVVLDVDLDARACGARAARRQLAAARRCIASIALRVRLSSTWRSRSASPERPAGCRRRRRRAIDDVRRPRPRAR